MGEWWERLGNEGWSAPAWPAEWYGRGISREDAVRAGKVLADHGALGPPGGLGLLLAGPTIVTHGTDEQKHRYLRDIVTGQKAWCQLFSEPGAGSDLAGLQTRALKDGDEWVVNGQKVWTSGGQVADLGMLIARTDADVPKHQGISYFAIDMHQADAIEVRPLKEMTGRALFNEVFLTEARVNDDALIGGHNNGWAVANTTLAFERAGLGAGGGSAAASPATPGTIAGDLDKRAGDFVGRARRGGPGGMLGGAEQLLIELAKGSDKLADPVLRQELMRLHTLNELARFTNLRGKAEREAGREIPGRRQPGQALDEPHPPAVPRARAVDPRRLRHAPRLRQRPQGARRGHRQPVPRDGDRARAVLPGPVDLRRHRRGAAQHHRRADPRPAEGAGQRPHHAVPGPAEERLSNRRF